MNGKIKATFGMSKSSYYRSPSLRLLTKAYGSDSGILVESSASTSMIRMFGKNGGISMDVFSFPGDKGEGYSTIKVESRPTPDLFADKPQKTDSSHVEIRSGVGSPTRIELVDKDNNKRAVFGNVTLEQQDTGLIEEYPTCLVFFDKKGKAIWTAP